MSFKIKTNKFGDKYIETTVTYSLKGYLPKDEIRTEISKEEAKNIFEETLDYYACSNTGSEWIMNDGNINLEDNTEG